MSEPSTLSGRRPRLPRQAALPPSLPPRLVGREAAAAYVGLSASKFDMLVQDGRMPRPRRIDSRRLWDVRQLDAAADDLPVDGGPDMVAMGNEWDEVLKR